jgi:PHP family Zn ribbon phosphoesterase
VKLLLDEMLSPDIAEQLRERGHDVQAIAASEHAELHDAEVLDIARSLQCAVVTNNVRDFRPLHIAAVQPGGAGHYGMVFMSGDLRRTKADIGRIVAALEAKLTAYPGLEDLANAEEWL